MIEIGPSGFPYLTGAARSTRRNSSPKINTLKYYGVPKSSFFFGRLKSVGCGKTLL